MRGTLSDLYVKYINALNEFCKVDPMRGYKNVVGDFGEQFACEFYGLKKSNGTGHDAVGADGRKYEIKTRTNPDGKVEIKKDAKADQLIVLLLSDSGDFTEIYNGSMKYFFDHAKYVARSNDYQMSLQNLRSLTKSIKQ